MAGYTRRTADQPAQNRFQIIIARRAGVKMSQIHAKANKLSLVAQAPPDGKMRITGA